MTKGVAYARIKQELPVEIIDTAEEYELLKLPIYDNFEFEKYDEMLLLIHLFKMPHPKTHKTVTLCIPSNIDLIHKAIAWVENAFI